MHLSSLIPAIDRKVRAHLYYPEDMRATTCQHDGVQLQAITMKTEDHAGITGLATAVPPDAKCCVVFLHGNGGCAASRAHLVSPFYGLGAQVVVADYRGYGGNDGRPSEQGLLQDARAFYKYAVQTSHLPVILVGHSLGGNVAIQLAAEEGTNLAGLITVNEVASVAAYAAAYLRPFISDRYDAIAERTFQRRFSRAMRLRPTEYLQQVRIMRARDLLETTNRPVDQVSWSVGYSDTAAFRKVFGSVTGIGPNLYRQRFGLR